MIHYSVLMEHNEESLQDLAHMQYDLFCQSNRIGRSVLSFAALVTGVINYTKWWGILLIFYGSYIGSSKYAAANHTARKLTKQLKAADMPFPSSNYVFRDQEMEIITLPERKTLSALKYKQVSRMGENADHFFVFRDQYGGYMIPKEELGDKVDDFRTFMEKKTGQQFRARKAPMVKLMERMRRKRG